MFIAVFLACINLFGVAFANMVGGFLMQTPFTALAEQHYVLLGMEMNSSRYMFLATVLLRILVLIFFLPHINEEGAWTMHAAIKDMIRLSREGFDRRILQFRIKWLRKRWRRHYEEQKMNKEE